MRAITRDALSEGLSRHFAYRWADGFIQRARLTPEQAAEHAAWLRSNPLVARRLYVRDSVTGRFCA